MASNLIEDSLVDLAFFRFKLEEKSVNVSTRCDDLWFIWLVRIEIVLSE